jgi:hypothetical protein
MPSNSVNGQPDIANITVVTDERQIIVPQAIINVVEVNTPGPAGPAGPQGPSGSSFVTASWAINALTASFLPLGTYNITSSWAQSASQASTSSRAISSSYALTASYALNGGGGAAFPYVGAAVITGSLIVSGSTTGIDTTNGYLNANVAGATVISVDWNNRGLYDTNTSASVSWNERTLYDSTGNNSVDWDSRQLLTPSGLPALSYPDDIASISEIYHQQNTTNTVEGESLSNTLLIYSGQAIRTSITGSAIDGNIVYLDTDGTWKTVNQTTVTSTKMLGIKLTGTYVLLEGDVVLEASSMIKTPTYGAPLYIWGGGTVLSSDIPTSGYVRVLGHCYYQNSGTSTNWIVKFRPSNDWFEI